MLRFASFAAGLLLLTASAQAQENAKLRITVRVPASVDSFQNQRLVAVLARDDTTGEGRDFIVDRHVDGKFSHTKGKDTILTVTIGEKSKLIAGANHKLVVYVFTPASKRTHIGEREGIAGPIFMQTSSWPKNLNVIMRAEK